MISFQLSPAKKITYSPAESTRIAVPRSGCLTIRPTGTARIASAIRKSGTRSCPSRRWNHQASISGIAIFRISLGWITTPTFSQRVAPFFVTPATATATSSATPTAYRGTAKRISVCGEICATMKMTPSAISMLRPWSAKREPLS